MIYKKDESNLPIFCTARCLNFDCPHHATNLVVDIKVKWVNAPYQPWRTDIKCRGFKPVDHDLHKDANSLHCDFCSPEDKLNSVYGLISRCTLCGKRCCEQHRKYFTEDKRFFKTPDASICIDCLPSFEKAWHYAEHNAPSCFSLIEFAIRKYHGDEEIDKFV